MNDRLGWEPLERRVLVEGIASGVLIVAILTQCGAEARGAPSVAAAMELFDRWRPSMIVSDISMPGQDGYTLIRRVRGRSFEDGGSVPAIALTAYARIEDRVRVLDAGFQMHVPKPVEPGELIAIVASLTGRGSEERREAN